MRRRRLSNPLGLAVLGTLIERPMHPYEIARTLKLRGKHESFKIRYGSLYSIVQYLEKQGFVAAEGTAREGRRPERTVYRITEDGRTELQERLRELLSEPVKEYPLFGAALSLAGVLHPDEVIGLLTQRLRRLELEIAGTRGVLTELVERQQLPRVFIIEGEYALAIQQAEVDWLRGLLAELADGTLGGIDYWRSWHEKGELPEEVRQRDWYTSGNLSPLADNGSEVGPADET